MYSFETLAAPEPPTATTLEQATLEQRVRQFYEQYSHLPPEVDTRPTSPTAVSALCVQIRVIRTVPYLISSIECAATAFL